MTTHKWVKYDPATAQIRHTEFESEGSIVQVHIDAWEQVLRDNGFVPQAEFDAQMDRLWKAIMNE